MSNASEPAAGSPSHEAGKPSIDLDKARPDAVIKELHRLQTEGHSLEGLSVNVAKFILNRDPYSYDPDFQKLTYLLNTFPQLVDLKKLSDNGLSPVHIAVEQQSPKLAVLLISYGADLEVKSSANQTPMEYFADQSGPFWSWMQSEMYEAFEFHKFVTHFPNETFRRVSLSRETLNLGENNNDVNFSTAMKTMTKRDIFGYFQRDLNSAENQALGDVLHWIHVPSTNGILLAKISNLVTNCRRFGIDRDNTWSFCHWPPDSSAKPADALLRYKEPVYSSRIVGVLKSTAIVFPCLRLRTVQYHKYMRDRVQEKNGILPIGPEPIFQNPNTIHLERTLDEAYYPGLGRKALERRNEDQVVTKAYRVDDKVSDDHLPILTVPQLWLWRLDNIVVSAFASENDHDQSFFKTAYISTLWPDVQMVRIISNQIRLFGAVFDNGSVEFAPTLNIFETTVVSILSEVDDYMTTQIKDGINIDREGNFIHKISDVRDELAMIQSILDQQDAVLEKLLMDPTRDDLSTVPPLPLRNHLAVNNTVSMEVEEARQLISQYCKRIEKIDRDTERIAQVIQDKLNLKRTAASMEEARASIQEARDAKLLSLLVIGFTLITLIFTPLSFLTSLFALDIDTFSAIKNKADNPTEVDGSGDEPYSGRKLTGIFIGVEALTFLLTGILTYFAMYWLSSALKTRNQPPQSPRADKTKLDKSEKSAPGVTNSQDCQQKDATSTGQAGVATSGAEAQRTTTGRTTWRDWYGHAKQRTTREAV